MEREILAQHDAKDAERTMMISANEEMIPGISDLNLR
jgi:hypothetical protein